MTGEQQEAVVSMWSDGVYESDIADALGVSFSAVHHFIELHRDLCPKRLRRVPSVKRPGYGDIASLYSGDVEVY